MVGGIFNYIKTIITGGLIYIQWPNSSGCDHAHCSASSKSATKGLNKPLLFPDHYRAVISWRP